MISIRDLRKIYRQGPREVIALDGVSLDIPSGSIHGIIGRSGAGKSTLVRCLTLLDRPTSGTVSVNDVDLTAASQTNLRQARRRIGMVFQHANLHSSRTVLDNVTFPLEITRQSKDARRQKARELIALVGLEGMEGSYPAQLSGGQRQRVGIARALASDPDVLLCDEPTSALDPSTTNDILELIRSLSDRMGLTVIVITHEMHVVKQLCDSVSLLSDGKIVEAGRLTDVASALGSQLSTALLPLPEIHDDGSTYLEVLATGDAAETPVASLISSAFPVTVRIAAATVEQLAGVRFAHYLLTLNRAARENPGIPPLIEHLEQNGFTAQHRTGARITADQAAAQQMGGAR